MAAVIWVLAGIPSAASASSADPYCTGAYGGASPQAGPALRFGVDPGIAGSAGGVQVPTVPDDPAKDLTAVRALDPPGRELVVRLNRLFWSDGQARIDTFQRQAAFYTGA